MRIEESIRLGYTPNPGTGEEFGQWRIDHPRGTYEEFRDWRIKGVKSGYNHQSPHTEEEVNAVDKNMKERNERAMQAIYRIEESLKKGGETVMALTDDAAMSLIKGVKEGAISDEDALSMILGIPKDVAKQRLQETDKSKKTKESKLSKGDEAVLARLLD